MDLELDEYYSGRKLYGDDFGPGELAEWYEDEREAYANLVTTYYDGQDYAWHALNRRHGFSRLPPDRKFSNALGLGSAFGDEFLPIADRVKAVTVVDPSEAFDSDQVGGVPLRRVKPQMSGDLPFEDHAFDLVLCFGVLHHVANVSHVVKELARCTMPGGFAIIREPISSMGDWRSERVGLTKRERGIPHGLFQQIVQNAGYRVIASSLCVFPPLMKICERFRVSTFNSDRVTLIDDLCSRAFSWNIRYYRPRFSHKFAPSAMTWVLTK